MIKNILLIIATIISGYYCIYSLRTKNCTTCKHKHKCWTKLDDDYAKTHICGDFEVEKDEKD